MFGTLVCTSPRQQALEFVENTDPATATSRNLRDKIHISCHPCRTRKARCNGDPRGCERCTSMGVKCTYPDPSARRRRRTLASKRGANSAADNHDDTSARSSGQLDGASKSRSHSSTQHPSPSEPVEPDHSDIFAFTNSDTERLSSPHKNASRESMVFSDDGGMSSHSATFFSQHQKMDYFQQCENVDADAMTWISDIPFDMFPFDTNTLDMEGPCATIPQADMTMNFATLTPPPSISPSVMGCPGSSDEWQGIDTTLISGALGLGTKHSSATDLCHDHYRIPSQDASSRSDQEACHCWSNAVQFLEQLESRCALDKHRIDALLKDLRDSLESLSILIACDKCSIRPEHNMLLAIAARHVGALCAKAITSIQRTGRPSSRSPSDAVHWAEAAMNATRNFDPEKVHMNVFTYQVNEKEAFIMLQSLVTAQIKEFQQLIDVLKPRSRARPGQLSALAEAEMQLKLAYAALRSSP